MAEDGLVTVAARGDAKSVTARLETALREAGLHVFARIDHGAGAAEAGLELRPTVLLIFGNAKSGTPLMQAAQTLGIDLPLKMLVWEDAAGKVWLTHNDPHFLAARHGLRPGVSPALDAMAAALPKLAQKAAEGAAPG